MSKQTTNERLATEPLRWLGSCIEGGRVFAFFLAGSVELIGVTRVFQAGSQVEPLGPWSWHSFPDAAGASDSAVVSLAESEVHQQESVLRERLERRLAKGGFLVASERGDLELPFLFKDKESTTWSFNVRDRAQPVTLRMAAREVLDVSFAHWSARFENLDEPLSGAALGLAHQFFLVNVARLMLGHGPKRSSSVSEKTPWELGQKGDSTPGTRSTPFKEFDAVHVDLREPIPAELLSRLQDPALKYLVVHLTLSSVCRQNCVFCTSARTKGSSRERSAMRDAERLRVGELADVLGGGSSDRRLDISVGGLDCLESPILLEVLERLKELQGLGELNLVTPGSALSSASLVRRLAQLSVKRVTLTLLGPDAATHDQIAGRNGAFRDLMKSLENLRQFGILVDLNFVAVRSNLDLLPKIAPFGAGRVGKIALLWYIADPGVGDDVAASLMPRFDALTQLLEEHRSSLEPHLWKINYVPPCVLPMWARSRRGESQRTYPDPPDSVPKACRKCEAYGVTCESISKMYLSIYGDGELSALTLTEARGYITGGIPPGEG